MAYVYQPTNPLEAFSQGFQFMEGLRGVQQQRQQQAQAENLQVQFANDVNAWQQNPTAEGWAMLQARYPQMAQQAKPLAELYGEQGKAAITNVGVQFLSADEGRRGTVLDEAIAAAENSRLPDVVKLFKDAKGLYATEPKAAETIVRAAVIQNDKALYETLFDKSSMYDTATIKELIAEGLEYGSPEFQEALKAKRQGDPWVGVPGVGLFLRKDLEQAAASGAVDAVPTIPEGAVKMLLQNPKLAPDFDRKYGKGAADRVLGGGGSNATGSFR